MKHAALFVLGGTLALAGCSSQNATGPAATATPRSTAHVSLNATPAATSDPRAASTPTRPINPTGSAYDKGKAYMGAHNYAAAERQFRLSIAHGQQPASSYDGLGTAAVGLRDYTTAYRAYRSALSLQPGNPLYLYRAAYSALYARDYHGCVSYATRYIAMRPRDASAYHIRLLAYGGLYDAKKQLQDARTILRLAPHDSNSYNDLGIALGNSKKYGASIQAFSQAIKLQPQNYSFYTNRAMVENLNHQQQLTLRDLELAETMARDPATKQQLATVIANYKKRMQQH